MSKSGARFHTAHRVNRSLTADVKKRALLWMTEHTPRWVSADRLTLLGLAAQIGAGRYALARFDRHWLLAVVLCLALGRTRRDDNACCGANKSDDIVPVNYMASELGRWEIAVLALLREAPMHPYQMQRLLHLRHKDEILVLKRGSLYHAIGRLLRVGLIAVETTGRDGRRPERTIYRITPTGLEEFKVTIRKTLATPRREASEFMAAVSFLVYLDPGEAVLHLKERAQSLDAEIAQRTAGLAAASVQVQRINLIESEYLLAMLKAEAAWIKGLEKEIRRGRLTWSLKAVLREAAANRMAAAKGRK